MGNIFVYSLVAAANASLLTAVTVMLFLPNPKRLLVTSNGTSSVPKNVRNTRRCAPSRQRCPEGCSGYVAVFQSTMTGEINPDVTVTYNPSSTLTGTCT